MRRQTLFSMLAFSLVLSDFGFTAALATGSKCMTIKKDMPYAKARALILARGYMPGPAGDHVYCTPGDKNLNPDSDVACKEAPEIEACSADGLCKMVFRDFKGYALDVDIEYTDRPPHGYVHDSSETICPRNPIPKAIK